MKNFGGVRRTAAAWVALVVTASGLIAVGAASPAAAAEPLPCRATIRDDDSTLPARPSGTDVVASAVLTLRLMEPASGPLRVSTDFGGRAFELGYFAQGARPGTYVFTTAGGDNSGTIFEPGTYEGNALRGPLAPWPSFGRFRVEFQSFSFATWTLDLTFTDCDSDGDAVRESNDNCPTVVNQDQGDLDGDRVGNACDTDADGDGAVDTSDNCMMLSNNQADADGDGIGDACDSTPYPPAPPPPATPGTPGTTTGPITVAPVASARTVALRYAKKKRVFKGSVGSVVGSCVANAEVSLWRKKRGADRRLIEATTNDLGKFRTPRVRSAGKYYVTVRSIESICEAVRSRAVRVR